jgi:hypothetical protein
VVHEPPEIVEGRSVVLDAGTSCREDDAEKLADREEIDLLAVDQHVEQLIHHLRKELALIKTKHVGAELRVLDAPPCAVERTVRDAHDARADVPVVVRAAVEGA